MEHALDIVEVGEQELALGTVDGEDYGKEEAVIKEVVYKK